MRTLFLSLGAVLAWYSLTACSGGGSPQEQVVGDGGSSATGGAAPTGGSQESGGAGGFGVGGSSAGTGGSVSTGGSGAFGGSGGVVGPQGGGSGGVGMATGGVGSGGVATGGEPCVVDHGDEVPALKEAYAAHFSFGAAIDAQYSSYEETIGRHFNSVTAENEMKFDALQPTEGNFTFAGADQMVDFAVSRGMDVRGHALIWHNQTPAWVFSGSSDQVLARMRTHIRTVMQHYQGKVQAWDVVNEAINDDGTLRGVSGGSGWYEALGVSYIEEAFRAAREADPTAKLFYNDFAHYHPPRRQAIYEMLAGLIADGVPIDGVGIQSHLHLEVSSTHEVTSSQTVEELETAIEMYASLGLEVQITEVDVSLYDLGEDPPSVFFNSENLTSDTLEQQAERYGAFFEMFRRHSDVISSLTLWGIVDSNTWLSEFPSGQEDFPLLFDANQQPKPAFWSVVDFCD